MTQPSTEKLSISENFGKAVTLYADNFLPFLGVSCLATFPTILQNFLKASPDQGLAAIGDLFQIAFILPSVFLSMYLTFTVASVAKGEVLPVRDRLAYIMARLWRGFAANLVFVLVVAGGLLLLIVPGIYCATVLCFFLFIILFENKGFWETFKRSDALVKGHFWEIFWANTMILGAALGVYLALFLGMKMLNAQADIIILLMGIVMAVMVPAFILFYYYLYDALRSQKDKALHFTAQQGAS
jgi:hypothetical protein